MGVSVQLSRSARMSLAAPSLVAIAFLTVIPVALLVWLSLHERHAYAAHGRFIGLANYLDLLHESRFWRSVWLTAAYTVSTVVLQLVVGLLGAVALRRVRRIAPVILSLVLLPYVLPTALVALVWRWMLDPSIGIVNAWGSAVGLVSHDFVWFGKDHIFLTVTLVGVWQFFPFVLLLLYAKLISIPHIRYEAAAVDGYSPLQAFFKVTLPELFAVLSAVLLLRGLFMATKFDAVWLLGGREATGRWIETLPILTYRTTFEAQQAGKGSTIAVALLLILLACTVIVIGIDYARGKSW